MIQAAKSFMGTAQMANFVGSIFCYLLPLIILHSMTLAWIFLSAYIILEAFYVLQ